ncbi:MAG: hypothetical protein IKQ75_00775 [Bacteroidales bacterium]|nr:hypothetical protein [Bacteroidales bacterium]
MKKVLCICAAGLMIAALSTSCNKKCECKAYAAGVVTATTTQEVEKGKKCSDYTILVSEDPKSGIECKATL